MSILEQIVNTLISGKRRNRDLYYFCHRRSCNKRRTRAFGQQNEGLLGIEIPKPSGSLYKYPNRHINYTMWPLTFCLLPPPPLPFLYGRQQKIFVNSAIAYVAHSKPVKGLCRCNYSK